MSPRAVRQQLVASGKEWQLQVLLAHLVGPAQYQRVAALQHICAPLAERLNLVTNSVCNAHSGLSRGTAEDHSGPLMGLQRCKAAASQASTDKCLLCAALRAVKWCLTRDDPQQQSGDQQAAQGHAGGHQAHDEAAAHVLLSKCCRCVRAEWSMHTCSLCAPRCRPRSSTQFPRLLSTASTSRA